MRNVYRKILVYLLSTAILLSFFMALPSAKINVQAADNIKKACWISYYDIEENLLDKSEAAFRKKVSAMYDNVVKYGMNTVIVHVRAMGDALYPSNYYPWSTYITTNRTNPGYDPLKIMVEIAHSKNLKFEAWINPYRLSRDTETTVSFMATPYYQMFLPFTIQYKSSGGQICLALDPAKQETRDLIANGVKEIVSNYDVDGIHFDDYFYVSGMANQLDIATKKANVNLMVSQVYKTIKSVNPNCTFGISPAGNLDNARAQGADIDTWLSTPGYIDYIMPQIYWTDIYVTDGVVKNMFTDRCSEWIKLNKRDIPIYVGLALYRVGTSSKTDLGWASSNVNLAYQYVTATQLGYDGYALFRYQWLEKGVAVEELNNLKNY
ncbi:MAG: family 10 glycosylhydrolase [Lachnospiraceae bacterium]|nr:family 10 glycosylhydrolase [Lachnospiraceae bacterium]